jgi:hypothetical protein
MRKRAPVRLSAAALSRLQIMFISLLPIIERVAHFRFRHLERLHDHEDAVAEVVALCWLWCVRLARKRKDARRFPTTLATLAARSVKAGRRVYGQQSGKDILSEIARQRHDFWVKQLREHGVHEDASWQEALTDNTQTPPPDAAAFRIDFAAWLVRLAERHWRIVNAMAQGERTQDLARRFGLSPARISQLRREFLNNWQRFHGETQGS